MGVHDGPEYAINAIEKEKLIVQSGQLETLKLAFYRQIASKQGLLAVNRHVMTAINLLWVFISSAWI